MILSFPSPSRFNTLIPWDLLLAIICAVSFHSIVLQEKVPPAFSVRKLLLSLGTRKKVSKGLSVQRTKTVQIQWLSDSCFWNTLFK